MNQGRDLLPRWLDDAIETAIEDSSAEWDRFVARNLASPAAPQPCAGHPLVVKYMPSTRAREHLTSKKKLWIGSDHSFTWGKAVYVTGIDEPLSTAIYGRVGVVSWFDPSDPADWRVFDARDARHQVVYLQWLEQQTLYNPAMLTVHSPYYLHLLRNIFRTQFRIDVVMCKPDEVDSQHWYTQDADTWLAVSDWFNSGELKGGQGKPANNYSDRFHDVQVTIVPEDEFVADDPALTRSAQFALRNFEPLPTPAPTSTQLTADIQAAYFSAIDPACGPRHFVRVRS
jgi:hypothetical protein